MYARAHTSKYICMYVSMDACLAGIHMVGQLLSPFSVQELLTASQYMVNMNILAAKIGALQTGTMKKILFLMDQMIMIKFQCFVNTGSLNKTA